MLRVIRFPLLLDRRRACGFLKVDARIQLLTNYYSFTLLLIGLVLRFSSIGAFKGLPNRGREGERERERGREGEREGGRERGWDGERNGEID